MLMLENTKNNLGIIIRGDYNDLCELYNAVYIVTELHYKVYKKYTKNRHDIDESEKDAIIGTYDNLNQYIKMFCDDLKDACAGNKGIGHVGDEKNVYYSCIILYPWAVYFMLSFINIDEEIISKEDLFLLDESCTLIEYDCYQSVLKHFSMKVWECVELFLGKQKALKIYTLIRDKSENIANEAIYIDAYCDYYCDNNKTWKKERKAMLLALIYELIVYDDKEKSKEYKQAIRDVETYTQEKFLSIGKFRQDMLELYHRLGHLNQEDYNEFKESYGHVDWNKIDL
ncbi:MAG: hypothetical protein LUG12_06730 [Erysipelotrichaceae bacterium]|nr:hypothetical protein [Erysipelotrichaceae bacterium]